MTKLLLSVAVLVVLCLFSCQRNAEQSAVAAGGLRQTVPADAGAAPVTISILPVESAGTMYERFLPLKYHLEKSLGKHVTIQIAKDYETAMTELGTGQVHIAVLDPATYCEVRARYGRKVTPLARVVGTSGTAARSVLVTKEGSGMRKSADVRGKRLALGSQQSSFSYLIPLAMLNDVGIGIRDFESVDYLVQEDRVALSVLIGTHDVGAMSESVARKYVPDGLEIIKASDAIPRFVLCASSRLTEDLKKKVLASLTAIRDGDASRPFAENGIGGFVVAEDRDFDVIRVMIKNITGKDYIEYGPKTIKVAVLPLYSAITLYDRYEPLMRYLSRKTGREFKLVVPRDFEDFMEVVKKGAVDFSYQNPYIFSIIARDVNIRPLVTTVGEDTAEGAPDEGARFRGVIIVRDDSAIKSVGDLKGKKILITSPQSAGGYLSQRIYLRRKGIDASRDMTLIDAKRQENVILGVYRGEADAGFVRESSLVVWKDAVDMKRLKVLARTTLLPNWPFALCRCSDPALVATVTRLLAELSDKDVLAAARIKGFNKADEADFEMLENY